MAGKGEKEAVGKPKLSKEEKRSRRIVHAVGISRSRNASNMDVLLHVDTSNGHGTCAVVHGDLADMVVLRVRVLLALILMYLVYFLAFLVFLLIFVVHFGTDGPGIPGVSAHLPDVSAHISGTWKACTSHDNVRGTRADISGTCRC